MRLHDDLIYDPSRRRRMEEQERMYVEDVEDRKIRDYDGIDAESLQRHEIERGSDILRQTYRQRWIERAAIKCFVIKIAAIINNIQTIESIIKN